LPQSDRHFPILGLHLLSLLAHNRIAEFHSEVSWFFCTLIVERCGITNPHFVMQLELIPLEAHEQNQYIRYARELEQHYMEGSYGKVLRAAASVPLPYYATFTQLLTETVRFVL
jgi:26S proteasome regulatory subunit N12